MTIAIWPERKAYTLKIVELEFVSEDGEIVRYKFGALQPGWCYTLLLSEIGKGNVEVVK